MILIFLFFFVFPAILITGLSVPLFLWIKNKTQQKLVTYLLASFIFPILVGLAFLGMIISIGDNPIDGGLKVVLGLGCYGIFLGAVAWFLGNRLSST